MIHSFGKSEAQVWEHFIAQEKLTAHEAEQFERYLVLLREWNEKINITRIVDVQDIVFYHFQDSIRVREFVDLRTKKGLCDIGSGGGFPGIPLSILYPELSVTLIEVNNKKVAFLETVIEELGLKNCRVSSLDWRTFLRDAPSSIDVFCARASLQLDELVRIFKPGCPYKEALLIYWASKKWTADKIESKYLIKEETYTVGPVERKFVFFAANPLE